MCEAVARLKAVSDELNDLVCEFHPTFTDTYVARFFAPFERRENMP